MNYQTKMHWGCFLRHLFALQKLATQRLQFFKEGQIVYRVQFVVVSDFFQHFCVEYVLLHWTQWTLQTMYCSLYCRVNYYYVAVECVKVWIALPIFAAFSSHTKTQLAQLNNHLQESKPWTTGAQLQVQSFLPQSLWSSWTSRMYLLPGVFPNFWSWNNQSDQIVVHSLQDAELYVLENCHEQGQLAQQLHANSFWTYLKIISTDPIYFTRCYEFLKFVYPLKNIQRINQLLYSINELSL